MEKYIIKGSNSKTGENFQFSLDQYCEYEQNLVENRQTFRIMRKIPYTDLKAHKTSPYLLRDSFFAYRNIAVDKIIITECEYGFDIEFNFQQPFTLGYLNTPNLVQFINSAPTPVYMEELRILEEIK